MKPLKLTISGFCAYSGRTDIDFTKLGNEGLYLITGDTGAGKTTIFDAICYALYDNPSGENRDDKMLRSKYASDNTETYVELAFQIHNDPKQKYVICRNPEYSYMSRKKDGTAVEKKKKKNAALICPDGNVLTKSKEIDNKICEVIGLDERKFKQIVMIAQGDFMKVLTAPTEERTKIFRDIFHTEKYRVLQDKLSEDVRISKTEFENLRKDIVREIENFRYDENADKILNDYISVSDRNEKYFADLPKIIECAKNIISEDKEKQKLSEKHLTDITKKFDDINFKVKTASDLLELINNRDNAKAETEKAEMQYNKYKTDYENKKSNKNKADETAKEIIRLEEKLPSYEKLNKLQQEMAKAENDIKALEEKIEKNSRQYSLNADKLDGYTKELEALQNIEADIEKCKSADNNLQVRLTSLKSLKKNMDDCYSRSRELSVKRKEFQNIQNEFYTAQEKYNNLEMRFLSAQAGILAQTLSDGRKCPVCGSVHHPEPARLGNDVPTEDIVKEAKSNTDTIHKTMADTSVEIGKISESMSELQKQITEKKKELYSENLSGHALIETVSGDITRTDEKIRRNDELLNKYSKDLKRKNELKDLTKSLENAQEFLKISIDECKEKIYKIPNPQRTREEIGKLGESLEYKTLNEAKAAVIKMQSEKEALEIELDNAKKQVENSKEILEKFKTKFNTLNEQVNNREKPDIDSLKKEQCEISEFKNRIDNKNSELKSRIKDNINIAENLSAYNGKFEKAQEKYAFLNSLSQTANANMSGKDKITLETYVQTEYFEHMLECANSRFLDMSGGKYEFIRSEEADDKRSKSGLEISIIDHTNNTVRSAKSLSGGESFMASLALALGLADEVQSQSGGIRIDTMFIDEGFGSLDDKALENAISVLGRLGGNRLVGIISHVSELKERINKQIVVTKDRLGGSKANTEI